MIPEDKVNEVRDRAGILEIVSDYVPLRKSGANYQGLCPFHGEKTPSFNVNPGRGIFHCFGCGVGGNVISFVMKIEGLSFPDAVRFLAKRVGVEIEEHQLSPAEARQRSEKEQLYEINALAATYYRKTLLEDPSAGKARDYLAKRGVSAETSDAYRLGYAPAGWDQLARYLEQKRVPLELAVKLGIIRKGQRGYQDLFRNRLLFVITDSNGRVTGFGGRVLDDSLPKYINSPESPIYRKSDILFGVDLAKSAMRETGAAIIVEGYFDHLGLYQAGVRNVAATCGTALTSGHVALLKRYAERCYILFDADSAGKKATFRAMELSFQENLPARVITLPEGEDPDSFVQHFGAEAFAANLEKSVPVFEYYLTDMLRHAGRQGLDGKIKAAGEIARMLTKVVNPIERELYEREAAKRLDIDRAVLKQGGGGVSPSQRPLAQPAAVSPRNAGPEEMLFSLMARFPEVLKRVADHGVEKLFGPSLLPAATTALNDRPMDSAVLLESIEDAEVRGRVASLLIDEGRLDDIDVEKAFAQCRDAVQKGELKDMKALVRQLAALDPESAEYSELLLKIDHLRNRKSQLS